jgi:hypothetical protein
VPGLRRRTRNYENAWERRERERERERERRSLPSTWCSVEKGVIKSRGLFMPWSRGRQQGLGEGGKLSDWKKSLASGAAHFYTVGFRTRGPLAIIYNTICTRKGWGGGGAVCTGPRYGMRTRMSTIFTLRDILCEFFFFFLFSFFFWKTCSLKGKLQLFVFKLSRAMLSYNHPYWNFYLPTY